EMTRAVVDAVEIPVVASGGAGHPEHLRAVLAEAGAAAALAASIFHYRRYSIVETKEYLARQGVPIRLAAPRRHGRERPRPPSGNPTPSGGDPRIAGAPPDQPTSSAIGSSP